MLVASLSSPSRVGALQVLQLLQTWALVLVPAASAHSGEYGAQLQTIVEESMRE